MARKWLCCQLLDLWGSVLRNPWQILIWCSELMMFPLLRCAHRGKNISKTVTWVFLKYWQKGDFPIFLSSSNTLLEKGSYFSLVWSKWNHKYSFLKRHLKELWNCCSKIFLHPCCRCHFNWHKSKQVLSTEYMSGRCLQAKKKSSHQLQHPKIPLFLNRIQSKEKEYFLWK